MRATWLLILIFLLALFAGCKGNRGGPQTAPNQAKSVGDGVGSDRSQARVLLEKGKELYRGDDDAQAADAFKQAVKLDPELPEAHFRLALSYEALNKQQEAEAEYKSAVEGYKKYLAENSKDGEAYYELGQSYAGLGEFSQAIREYRQATKYRVDDPDIFYDLGTALTKMAQYDEAVAAFSKVLELDPENYRAQDALDDAKEGVQRIKAGKKHQEDLLKKQQEDELKKAGELPGASPAPSPSGNRPALPTAAPKKPTAKPTATPTNKKPGN
ncbi:MAG TPA: tetratricopeptide repeat protein [Pyrinomonadaceae bacterium]|nr:tetratricopeptide repeat protein [Pyrinomonadaceae bacterium]